VASDVGVEVGCWEGEAPGEVVLSDEGERVIKGVGDAECEVDPEGVSLRVGVTVREKVLGGDRVRLAVCVGVTVREKVLAGVRVRVTVLSGETERELVGVMLGELV
jgi:hypothetical protein